MQAPRDLAPVRWLRRLRDFLRWYHGQIKSYTQLPTVSFDAERIRLVAGSGDENGFAWADVRRIGYRTLDALGDDHFVEFHLADDRVFRISTGWPGAIELSEHVRRLPDALFDPKRGCLANVIGNDSIIVWPSRDAGGSLDD